MLLSPISMAFDTLQLKATSYNAIVAKGSAWKFYCMPYGIMISARPIWTVSAILTLLALIKSKKQSNATHTNQVRGWAGSHASMRTPANRKWVHFDSCTVSSLTVIIHSPCISPPRRRHVNPMPGRQGRAGPGRGRRWSRKLVWWFWVYSRTASGGRLGWELIGEERQRSDKLSMHSSPLLAAQKQNKRQPD